MTPVTIEVIKSIAQRNGTPEHLLQVVQRAAVRWHRAAQWITENRLVQDPSFTQGRMEGYVQSIADLLDIPHKDALDLLKEGLL